jgi:FHS family L-fucose permease-like MFS transporter
MGQSQYKYAPALSLMAALFFTIGFITCLNDILIPHLKALFNMNYVQTLLIQMMFFGAYFVMSIPSGMLIKKIGYQHGIVIGFLISATGALLFWPASSLVNYPFFLFAFFILASGFALLQVSANPYISILGSPETASARLTMTQALNSLGTTIAPVFGSLLILGATSGTAAQQAAVVKGPYIGISIVLFVVAIIFYFVKLPVIAIESGATFHKSAWRDKHLVLGALGLFVYVGAEVSIGSFMINFDSSPEIGNISMQQAAKYVAMYWGGAMIGRFSGAVYLSGMQMKKKNILMSCIMIFAFLLGLYLTKNPLFAAIFFGLALLNFAAFMIGRNKPARTLTVFACFAAALVTLTLLFHGHFVMWTLLAVGLFNSIMFPTIFTLAIDGLGDATSQGSGILCSAIVGGALIPLITASLADVFGVHYGFMVTLICYAYIAFYGIKGHKH